MSVCGVKFCQISETDAETKNYAFNSNRTYDVSVVFPNDVAGNGIAYDVPTTTKVDITADLVANHMPDREILVGPSNPANRLGSEADRVLVMKLSLTNMVVGGDPVCVSDYKISCDTSGMKVSSGSRSLGALTYFNVTSDTGVIINNQSAIESSADGTDYLYAVDMSPFGIKAGDILGGQFHIEMGSSDTLTIFDATKAEPLTDAEKRAFKALGVL